MGDVGRRILYYFNGFFWFTIIVSEVVRDVGRRLLYSFNGLFWSFIIVWYLIIVSEIARDLGRRLLYYFNGLFWFLIVLREVMEVEESVISETVFWGENGVREENEGEEEEKVLGVLLCHGHFVLVLIV